MAQNSMHSLVDDALYGRRMHRDGSCFTWNIAGAELIQGPDATLPVIEQVLRNVVAIRFMPLHGNDSTTKRDGLNGIHNQQGEDVAREFPGLAEVLGAYLVIGTRTDSPHTFAFLRSLPISLRAKAIGVIGTFFGRPGGPTSVRHPVTNELLEFLVDETKSQEALVRAVAESTLKYLRKTV
jgi:hypothetical protein